MKRNFLYFVLIAEVVLLVIMYSARKRITDSAKKSQCPASSVHSRTESGYEVIIDTPEREYIVFKLLNDYGVEIGKCSTQVCRFEIPGPGIYRFKTEKKTYQFEVVEGNTSARYNFNKKHRNPEEDDE